MEESKSLDQLVRSRFPRSAKYHPDWIESVGMGGNSLWTVEWLSEALHLKPGMRVLDLGCGRAATSIFLAREFGVEVWAADLWIDADENRQRIADAGVGDRVFPLHCDARGLPFASEFFDAITIVDAFSYFGTDDLYLNYLARFVPAGGTIAMAGAGLAREIDGELPDHLRGFWTQDFWCLHSALWWERHWGRTGVVEVEVADSMPEGWQVWLDWQQTAHPDNTQEIETVQQDRGEYLAYVRMIAKRRIDVRLESYCWPDALRSFPAEYQAEPLLRG